jgi:hypothetical protein
MAAAAAPCCFCLGICLSCSGALANGDGRAFGDDLGRFRVAATMKSTTCGKDALDSPTKWEFDVILSHDEEHFYWNTGADAVVGTLSDDGRSFALTSNVSVDAAASSECTIERTDSAEGTLDDARNAKRLEGSLRYRFSGTGATCTSAEAQAGFAALPCTIAYGITAKWVSAR